MPNNFTTEKKYLQNQQITPKDALNDYYHRNPESKRNSANIAFVCFFGMIGFALGLACLGLYNSYKVKAVENKPVEKQPACFKCHQKQMLTGYFKRNKVLDPEKMADAVIATRSPRLMAAIAVGGERKTPHTARNTGYKGRYSGAWQTHPMWGKVTKDVTQQALIAEFALETHVIDQKDIIKGLNAYGGESNKKRGKYAYNVLNEFTRVQ